MATTTITVIRRPSQAGDFTIVHADWPIAETPGTIFQATETMQFTNDGQTQLHVANMGIVPTVIQFRPPDQEVDGVDFAADERQAFEVPEDSLVIFGPFPRKPYNTPASVVVFTVTELTGVFLWARTNLR